MKPYQVGITGGIGSGKSLVRKIFSCLGVPTYDADSRAKEVMITDQVLVEQIKLEFGSQSYDGNGALNRQYMSEQVFSNPDRLIKLNSLVHPRVRMDYQTWLEQQTATYILREAALLFETGAAKSMDKIIAVYTSEAIRVSRVLKRDPQRTAQSIQEIMHNQMNEEEKRGKADYVILNDDSILVIPQVLQLHEQFMLMHPQP